MNSAVAAKMPRSVIGRLEGKGRGEFRIRLDFPYDQESITKVKQMKGAVRSRSLKAWHIPYKKESYSELRKIFDNIILPGSLSTGQQKSGSQGPEEKPEPCISMAQSTKQNTNMVKIEVIGKKIFLRLRKNEEDIKFIQSIRYSRWNNKAFLWEIPNYPGNLDWIRDFFNGRITELIINESYTVEINSVSRNLNNTDLLIIKTIRGRLKLIFGYNKTLLDLIKKIPLRSYDSKNKWWSIPYSDRFLEEVKRCAEQDGLKVIYEEEDSGESGVEKITPYDIPNYRTCPDEMILKLRELRYSDRTIKICKTYFEEFINYYNTEELDSITGKQIIRFLRYLVMERKV